MSVPIKDYRGQRFGRLVALERLAPRLRAGGEVAQYWLCRCDCGNTKALSSTSLRCGTLSCGCLRKEITHGKSHSAEYRTWRGMKGRCFNRMDKSYARYGGRGITVCERWSKSFAAFFEDVGERPGPSHSIDRINNNGNYEPNNVRWSLPSEQAGNRRTSRLVIVDGESLCLTAAARRLGFTPGCIEQRMRRGATIEQALGLVQ